MATSIVSAKYQIVIPKELRKQLVLRPGQKVYVTSQDGDILISSKSQVSGLYGSLRGVWGSDAAVDADIATMRTEANRDRN